MATFEQTWKGGSKGRNCESRKTWWEVKVPKVSVLDGESSGVCQPGNTETPQKIITTTKQCNLSNLPNALYPDILNKCLITTGLNYSEMKGIYFCIFLLYFMKDLLTELQKKYIMSHKLMVRLKTHRQAAKWWHLGSILVLEVHIDLKSIDYLINSFHSFID